MFVRLSKNLQFCCCVILYSGKQNVCIRNDISYLGSMPSIDSPLENNEKSSHKHESYLILFTKRSKFLVLLFEIFIGDDPILLLFIYKIFIPSFEIFETGDDSIINQFLYEKFPNKFLSYHFQNFHHK